MSERVDYASTDLRRRHFHFQMLLISVLSAMAFTTFLLLFGSAFFNVTEYVTSLGQLSVLYVFLTDFIWIALMFSLGLIMVLVSGMVYLEMVNRQRDIGLMKSIGIDLDTINDHFVVQSLVILLSGTALGVAVGSVAYMGSLVWLSAVLAGVELVFQYPILMIGLMVLLVILVGYLAAQQSIQRVINDTPIGALNPRVSKDVRHAGYLDSLGLSFRVASRATARRARGTKRVILSLFLSVTLASLMWAGSAVVETTTDAYILRSAGSNVVLVGHHDVLSRYASSLSLTGTPVDENFTFIQSDYMVPADLLTALAVQDGVLQLEPRLIESETAYELPEVVWDPQLEDHRLIGDHRNATLLVVGIDWDLTVSDWYYYGSMAMSSRDVMIGGEAARRMFEDPLLQDVRIRGVTFSVTGVAFDVCNGGMLALMSLDEMRTLWSTDGTNLLLVRLRSLSTEVLASLGELASSYGFETLVQDSVVQSNIQTVSAIWFLVKPLVVVALLGAVLSLANYLLVSFSSRIRDYVIMRSIGASPRFITKTIAAEGLDICLRGGIPGVVLALIVSVYFLVPEAAVPHILFIPTFFVAMLATLVAVVLISCIPVHMILNQRSDLHVSEFAV